MLLCSSSKTVVAFVRHAYSAAQYLNADISCGMCDSYPSRYREVESRLWPVIQDKLAHATLVLSKFIEHLPSGVKVQHWGTGPFLRHMQTAIAAISPSFPDARVGVHSYLQERPLGELDSIEPHLRAQADPEFAKMLNKNWWRATPSHGISHDQYVLSIRNFWEDEASRIADCGVYFSSNGTLICMRYLAECLDQSDLVRPSERPWEIVPNLGLLCYSNFPFDGNGAVTPYLSYRMAMYPNETGEIVVIPQELIPGFVVDIDEGDFYFSSRANRPLVRWPKLYSLSELERYVDRSYPTDAFDRETGIYKQTP